MEEEKFDAIVVGGGPAGMTAALVMAKAGLEVVVFEKGEYPGAKNIFGGILFTPVLGELIPDFLDEAPLERKVTRRKFALLSEESELEFSFKTRLLDKPPFNHTFTAIRARFDQWYASKAEEAGAMVLCETTVDDFIYKENKIVGVKTRREEGDLYSDVVICAEGANPLLSEKAGMRKKLSPEEVALSVKEVIRLPKEVIEDRFNLLEDEGCAHEYFGYSSGGMIGAAFIYTNQETVSIGLGVSTEDIVEGKENVNDLLEKFKYHPCIEPYVRGGESLEYSAHLIPEGGYKRLPRLVRDGLILVGDAAGFVNATHYHEGTNLAMASGKLAGEAVVKAKEAGDFSEQGLRSYVQNLNDSFVIKDLKKFRHFYDFMRKNKEILRDYPAIYSELLSDYFTISQEPKEEIQKKVLKKFRNKIGYFKTLRLLYQIRKALF